LTGKVQLTLAEHDVSEPDQSLEIFLKASPEQLWPLLTNTERLNVITGLPQVTYREEAQEVGLTRRFFSFRHMGLDFVGEELPSAWHQNQFFEINRVYSEGPFETLRMRVELTPPDEAGSETRTLCTFKYWIAPRGDAGRQILAGMGDQMLVAIQKVLVKAVADLPDTIEEAAWLNIPVPGNVPNADELATAARLAEATRAIHDSPIIDHLVDHLLYGPDLDLRRIRPLELSRNNGLDTDDCLRTLLAATRTGLVNMLWKLLCPHCRSGPVGTTDLSEVISEGYCPSCNIDFEVDLSSSLELIFQPHPQVREVIDAPYCKGGPSSTPHLVLQQCLAPGESLRTHLLLNNGSYRFRGESIEGARILEITSGEGSLHDLPALNNLKEGLTLEVTGGLQGRRIQWPSTLGELPLTVHNDSELPVVLHLEDTQWPSDSLLAADVISLQTFRELHTGQLLSPGVSLGVGSVTILFTDLVGSTAMYERLGDTDAFSLVWDHFDVLKAILIKHRGALVKSIGDAVMASFSRPMDAQRAALDMQQQIGDAMMEAGHTHPVHLKMGIHTGPAITITANGRLDYFGSTVNLAARTESQSSGDDIIISESHAEATNNAQPLTDAGWQGQKMVTALKGFDGNIQLLRFTREAPEG